jgi:hypothetical protein
MLSIGITSRPAVSAVWTGQLEVSGPLAGRSWRGSIQPQRGHILLELVRDMRMRALDGSRHGTRPG